MVNVADHDAGTGVGEKADAQKGEQTLIGEAAEDNEVLLVDGILGFGLSVSVAIALVTKTLGTPLCLFGLAEANALVLALAMVVCGLVLLGGQHASDYIQTNVGKNVLLALFIASLLLALVFQFLGWQLATVMTASLGVAFTLLFYARFLTRLTKKALVVLVNCTFIICGLGILVAFALDQTLLEMVFAGAVLVSLATGVVHCHKPCVEIEVVSIEDSKQRSVTLSGHNYTIFTIAFMLTPVILVFDEGVVPSNAASGIALVVALAGIASFLFERVDERTYKESFKKSMAVIAAVFLLALPLVPSGWGTLVLSAYLLFCFVNFIILLCAVVESARFNMVSPVWFLGKDGFVFCIGAAAGFLLFSICSIGNPVVSPALEIACAVAVVVVAAAQIRINYQVYPFEPQIDPPKTEETQDEESRNLIEQSGARKRVYQRKREHACEVFRLSPREREVLLMLLHGRDTKAIMNKFYISQSTAKTHIYNIYRKFEVHSRQELLDFIENIELPDEDAQN